MFLCTLFYFSFFGPNARDFGFNSPTVFPARLVGTSTLNRSCSKPITLRNLSNEGNNVRF